MSERSRFNFSVKEGYKYIAGAVLFCIALLSCYLSGYKETDPMPDRPVIAAPTSLPPVTVLPTVDYPTAIPMTPYPTDSRR